MSGANVVVSVCLAGIIVVMVNHLAHWRYGRWNISSHGLFALSGKTKNLVSQLEGEINVVVFFRRSHERFDDVRNLLKEYRYAADRNPKLQLEIEFVDPDRDLARTRELAQVYDVHAANLVVFESGGRRKYVESKDIVHYDVTLSGTRAIKRYTGFRGEQAFTSAIQSVVQTQRPVVYFLGGHGERDISDFSRHSGYSNLARTMRRDNMVVKPLRLTGRDGVPADAAAVVIAGPDKRLSTLETDLLAVYLNDNGRLFVLLDPAVETGLEALLGEWGVSLGPGVAVGLTLTGRELVVSDYGDHPITRSLREAHTMFYMPRAVEPQDTPVGRQPGQVDRPRATSLAANTKDGWLEMDLAQSPPRFDAGVDRRGPISVAVAVERGPVSGLEVEISPTRMVVLGDSYFVSNAALRTGVGGNIDFFMSSLNWLLERETLMGISPRVPGELRLDMNRRRLRLAMLVIVGGAPLLAALIGIAIWVRRRQ